LLRAALRAAGWRSEIFAEATHDELVGETLPLESYPSHAAAGDVLVYQFSTSSVVAEVLEERPEPLVLDYHNVTDPKFDEAWDPVAGARSADAREQLGRLAPRAVLGLADSAYNEADLVAAGCRRTAVVPVLFDLGRLAADPDLRVAARLAAEEPATSTDWLFVGRVVPSKAPHDLVKALWAYRRCYDPGARLHLVGPTPSGHYLRALRQFAEDLDLAEAVRIAGEVSDAALAAYFDAADVYVSASAHEGFGVPLREAMACGVPVVARAVGAVAATVGDAGLLLERSDPALVAAAVRRVVTDTTLRDALVAAGRRRVGESTLAEAAQRAVAALATVAGPPPAPTPDTTPPDTTSPPPGQTVASGRGAR
jgi:glycosyltransferase involved in cell wall biosynthesis